MFAEIELNPGGLLAWLLVGLISGWLAGVFMQGTGFGILTNILIGLIGAFVGGILSSFFLHGEAGFWGSTFIAFVGACVLIALGRAFAPPTPRV